MSKHSSIFSVSIPTREQRTDADKMSFPQLVGVEVEVSVWGREGGRFMRRCRKQGLVAVHQMHAAVVK